MNIVTSAAGDLSRVVVNLSHLLVIPSVFLGMLVELHHRVGKAGGKLKLCGLCPNVLPTFKVTHLDRVFDICDDERAPWRVSDARQPALNQKGHFFYSGVFLVVFAWTMKQIHLEQAIAPKAEEAEGTPGPREKGGNRLPISGSCFSPGKSESAEKYPGFRFDTANGDPEFVEVVKKAVAQINFDDESVFPPEEAEIYRRMKREGNRALSILEQAMAKAKEEGTQPADAYFCVSLDQAVFDLIGEAELLKYIPFNDVRFFQVGHHILVTFDSLLRPKVTAGQSTTCARSPR